MTRAREEYVREYWSDRWLVLTLTAARVLAEDRRRRGWSSSELSPHQNKVALETALGIVRASWRSAIENARREVFGDTSLSPEETSYALGLLDDPRRLETC